MAKYFGFEDRQDFIDEIYVSELSIKYRIWSYVFTYDARGHNFIPECIGGIELSGNYQNKNTISAPTVEELIDIIEFPDGVTLNEALEMENRDF